MSSSAEKTTPYTMTNASGPGTTPKRKSSDLRFLTWVAFTRNYAPIISDVQRRTCPLIGCETPFSRPKEMLQHVYNCGSISNGLYRCFDCQEIEQIGRYHTNRCKKHRCIDRYATFTNSLKQKKRRFSLESFRDRSLQADPPEPECTPQTTSELQSSWHAPTQGVSEMLCDPSDYVPELDTNWRENPQGIIPELIGSSATTGLNFTNQSIHTLNSASYPHNPSTNPNIHHDPFNFVEYGEPPQYEPAELDSSNESAWLAQPQRSQGSDPIWPSPHPPINDTNSQDWPEEKPSRYGCTSEFNTSGMFENVESVHEELPKSGAYKPQVGIPSTSSVCISTSSNPDFSDTLTISPVESRSSTDPSFEGSYVSPIATPLAINPRLSKSKFQTAGTNNNTPSFSFIPKEQPELPLDPECDDTRSMGLRKMFHPSQSPWHEGTLPSGVDEDEVTPVTSTSWPYSGRISDDDNLQSQCSTDPLTTPSPDIIGPAKPLSYSQSPSIGVNPLPKYRCCLSCDHEPTGKEANKASNLKRHRNTCRRYSPYALHQRTYKCNYDGCPKQYTRSDNCRDHQKKKGHIPLVELEVVQYDRVSQARALHSASFCPTQVKEP